MARRFVHPLALAALAAALGACTIDTKLRDDGSANGSGSAPAPLPLPGLLSTPSGVPCDVAQVLASADGECTACHGSPPVTGVPMSLVSYADLSAPSPSDPTKTTAQAALDRMLNAKNPMPPSPLSIAPAEIQTFQTWVNAGMPTADCSTPITPPPPSIFDTPHQCSTGTPAAPNNNGSATMRPGVACISCHTQSGEGEVPKGLGGTVFKTAHEPNDCSGRSTSSAGNALTVQIIDAAGTVVQSLAVNRIGNFYSDTPPPNPFTAKVIDNVTQLAREMVKPQKSGDCNACHTENGTTTVIGGQSAPGRIMAP